MHRADVQTTFRCFPLASNLLPFKLHHSKFLWRNTHVPCVERELLKQTTWRDHFLSHIMVTSGANSVAFFPVSRMKKNNRCLSLKSLRPDTQLTELNISPKRRKPGFLSEKNNKAPVLRRRLTNGSHQPWALSVIVHWKMQSGPSRPPWRYLATARSVPHLPGPYIFGT